MTRALLWKEWREQRRLALVGLTVAAVSPLVVVVFGQSISPDAAGSVLVDLAAFSVAVLVWPLFAALAGAATGAGEATSATRGFLLSRPVSRVRIWAAKLAVGMLTVVAVVAVSIGALWAVRLWLAPGRPFYLVTGPLPATEGSLRALVLTLVVATFLLAALAATLVRRSLLAALAGIVGGAITVAGAMTTLGLIGARGIDARFLMLHAGIATVLFAVASACLFAWRGVAGLRVDAGKVAAVLATTFVAWVAAMGAMAHAETRMTLDNARVIGVHDVNPERGLLAVEVDRENRASSQVWLLDRRGEVVYRAPRGSSAGIISPDGRWLFYATAKRGIAMGNRGFGFLRMRAGFRGVRIGGSREMELDGLRSPGGLRFAPDGARFAFRERLGVYVGDVDRGRGDPLEIAASSVVGLAWSAGGDSIFLLGVDPDGDSTMSLHRHEPGSATTSRVTELPVRVDLASRVALAAVTDRFIAVEYSPSGSDRWDRALGIVDLADGGWLQLTLPGGEDGPELCGRSSVAVSPEAGVVYYWTCLDTWTDRDSIGTLHVLDPATGVDRVLLEGPASMSVTWEAEPSPDGRRVAAQRIVRGEAGDGTERTLMVAGLDGAVEELEPSFVSGAGSSSEGARTEVWTEGWIGATELLFSIRRSLESDLGIRRLVVLDVETRQEGEIPLFAGSTGASTRGATTGEAR